MARIRPLTFNGDGFAFDPSSGDTFVLNGTAMTIYDRLTRGEPLSQISTALADLFGLDLSRAERDLAEFLHQLKTMGLTEVRS